jgi:hypothetical protein
VKRKPVTPEDVRRRREKARERRAERARRQALRAAETAQEQGVDLSDWESGFLDTLDERLARDGRAFYDPEKGSPDAALSLRQAAKLKEVVRKARGETDKMTTAPRPCPPATHIESHDDE